MRRSRLVPSVALALCLAGGAGAQEPLPARFQAFLEEVAPLLAPAEREAFLALTADYQRDAFVRAFWRARDPYPETPRNELAETWAERIALARERFGGLGDERARLLLINGAPQTVVQTSCAELLRPLEIWFFARTERLRESFALVFVSPGGARSGPYQLWYPSQGFAPLLSFGGGRLEEAARLFEEIGERCARGSEIVDGLSAAVDWGRLEERGAGLPKPNPEWLAAFRAGGTELPAGATTFDARLEVGFPARVQSRTVVQVLLEVEPTAEAAAAGRHFALDGELLRDDELFESFRYRFYLREADRVAGRWPLVFERHLRPGAYRLVLRVEEIETRSFHRQEAVLNVPATPEPRIAAADAAPPAAGPAATAEALAEAVADLPAEDVSITLLALPNKLLTGKVRVEATTGGTGVAKVRFELDGKAVLTKAAAPYSAEVDLGSSPRLRRLRAVALDLAGQELAADEAVLNGGPHRFAIRLLAPTAGRRYERSVPVRAEVQVPEGEQLERVEVYLNEDLAATLYQAPFAHPLLLPQPGVTGFVRAVAVLGNGSRAEDAAVFNAEASALAVDVRFVELFTSVVDRRGRPVEGLTAERFRVVEDKVPQTIRRFELVRDLPIHTVLLVDTSTSMTSQLPDALEAARRFLSTVLSPRDRGAVITFSDRPNLVARFTPDPERLAGALGGVRAEGETALYDALVYALFYTSGVPGKRALIVLSDGEDVTSKYRFEDVIEYARRTGVAIYTLGLRLPTRAAELRLKLSRLASETGGLSFFLESVGELERVYKAIETELRSQYLLAYQSTQATDDGRFREVEVTLTEPGLEAKTVKGYYP
jgi:Ca-activated chloride channel homolog